MVRQVNRLPRGHPYSGYESATSVHLHGGDSLPVYDGCAEGVTRPGFYKDYVYDAARLGCPRQATRLTWDG